MTRPRAVELFAGFGGLSRAVEDVFDAETVAMSEIEPAALQILGHRYPDVASLGDVTRVDWHRVNRLYGPIDIIGGGFPCTDVSSAGKMAGLSDGTRSGLWSHFAKAVSILRPKMVVIENVRGLLSTKAGRGNAPDPALHPLLRQLIEESDAEAAADPSGDDLGSDDEDLGDDDGRPVLLRALGAVLGDLAGIGFDAAWHGLRAADVGAPHGRFRVFICAWPADSDGGGWGPHVADVFAGEPDVDGRAVGHATNFVVEGGGPVRGQREGGPWPSGGSGGRVGEAADSDGEGWEGSQPAAGHVVSDGRVDADTSGDGWDEGWPESAGFVGGPDAAVSGDAVADSGGDGCERDPERDLGTEGRVTASFGDDAVGRVLGWGPYAAAIARWEAVLGRPAPAPTELGSKGQPRLSPKFVEWMQGCPAGWVTDVPGIGRNDMLKALGNGVVSRQAAEGIRRILAMRAAWLASRAA